METKEQLFEKIDALYTEFKEEHGKSTKAAASRARKLLGELKKLATPYRAASVAEAKTK
jgi:hypothetical protein